MLGSKPINFSWSLVKKLDWYWIFGLAWLETDRSTWLKFHPQRPSGDFVLLVFIPATFRKQQHVYNVCIAWRDYLFILWFRPCIPVAINKRMANEATNGLRFQRAVIQDGVHCILPRVWPTIAHKFVVCSSVFLSVLLAIITSCWVFWIKPHGRIWRI